MCISINRSRNYYTLYLQDGGLYENHLQSDSTSDRQRMRGVRGSDSSSDEHVRSRSEHRRQTILNKQYGESPEDANLLYDALGDKPGLPNHPKPQSPNPSIPLSSVENGVSLFKGRGSPSYGRGALLTSELISKLKSPSCASSSASNESPPTGKVAILLNKLSCQSAAEMSSISVCEVNTVADNSDSERIFGKMPSPSDHIRSISEIDSFTESESSALTRNERRRQAQLSGINSDIDSDSQQSAMNQSRKEVRSHTANTVITTSPSSLEIKPTRTYSIETCKGRAPFVISSGSESSASGVSIVEASMRGQAEFKGVRLPKSSNMKGNSSRQYVHVYCVSLQSVKKIYSYICCYFQ